jgi:hypothetical protein
LFRNRRFIRVVVERARAVRHGEVDPAVTVEIGPRAAGAGARTRHARGRRDIGEPEVAVVAEQRRRLEPARDREVEVAVAVVVAGGDARGARDEPEPRGHAHVGEVPRAVVAEKAEAIVLRTRDHDVVVAVAVEVDERHPAAELPAAGEHPLRHVVVDAARQGLVGVQALRRGGGREPDGGRGNGHTTLRDAPAGTEPSHQIESVLHSDGPRMCRSETTNG